MGTSGGKTENDGGGRGARRTGGRECRTSPRPVPQARSPSTPAPPGAARLRLAALGYSRGDPNSVLNHTRACTDWESILAIDWFRLRRVGVTDHDDALEPSTGNSDCLTHRVSRNWGHPTRIHGRIPMSAARCPRYGDEPLVSSLDDELRLRLRSRLRTTSTTSYLLSPISYLLTVHPPHSPCLMNSSRR